MWTDALQSLFMFLGVLAAVIKGIITVGGFTNVIDAMGRNEGLNLWK